MKGKHYNVHNVHKIVCDYLAANGPKKWRELHDVVLVATGRNLSERSWGVSYLDSVSTNSVRFPKENDRRYVTKDKDGYYHLVE